MVDFKTLRDNYLKQWHELEFHPAFETFVAPGSVKGYGVYDKISNTFPRNIKRFEIYVEPVGYDFKKIVEPDDYNHTEKILYSYRHPFFSRRIYHDVCSNRSGFARDLRYN